MFVVLRLYKWEFETNLGPLNDCPFGKGSPGYLPVFETREDAEKYGECLEIRIETPDPKP